ncbi:MAG: HDOD domain-containing protein [Burkholderiales bacterium]|nr:HDOD domain-containing protein [Burkholderiales bacterium]
MAAAAVHAAPPRVAPDPPPNGSSVPVPEPQRHEEPHARFFCWLVGVSAAAAPGPDEPPAPVVAPLFERLDEVIASDTLRANLLPRAPHVVPQLMKTLRDESYSSVDVASRISRDVVLSAEVIRSATSTYRPKEGDDEGEIDLARAVAMIGTAGLRRAIASVVLRPIFDAAGDTLSAKAAVKIWRDADKKARLSAALAGQQALDPFDGYLAGLLHNSGWTATLRAIDGFEDLLFSGADLAHPAVVPQLLRRRDALFGAIVGPWSLSPAIDRLAGEVGEHGLDSVRSPLGLALREANRLAALHALAPAEQRPASGVPGWATLPKPVQDCYLGLGRAA